MGLLRGKGRYSRQPLIMTLALNAHVDWQTVINRAVILTKMLEPDYTGPLRFLARLANNGGVDYQTVLSYVKDLMVMLEPDYGGLEKTDNREITPKIHTKHLLTISRKAR